MTEDKRFSFLEVETDHDSQIPTNTELKHIPDNQYLTYFDLKAINPTATTLNTLAKRLLLKYQLIPLSILLHHIPFKLPQRLNEEFHSNWLSESLFTMHTAMLEPFNEHTLRILHNATGYSIKGIPISQNAIERFFQDDLQNILKNSK